MLHYDHNGYCDYPITTMKANSTASHLSTSPIFCYACIFRYIYIYIFSYACLRAEQFPGKRVINYLLKYQGVILLFHFFIVIFYSIGAGSQLWRIPGRTGKISEIRRKAVRETGVFRNHRGPIEAPHDSDGNVFHKLSRLYAL